jgi:hypothetical protein
VPSMYEAKRGLGVASVAVLGLVSFHQDEEQACETLGNQVKPQTTAQTRRAVHTARTALAWVCYTQDAMKAQTGCVKFARAVICTLTHTSATAAVGWRCKGAAPTLRIYRCYPAPVINQIPDVGSGRLLLLPRRVQVHQQEGHQLQPRSQPHDTGHHSTACLGMLVVVRGV